MNIKAITVVLAFFLPSLPNYVVSSPPQKVLEELQKEITNIIEIAKPSVVTISVKSSRSYTISKDNGLLSFLKNKEEKRTVSYKNICSGLIYNDQGYIVTKSSSINENEKIKVILCDGREYESIYIGHDQETGLTVLKIEGENLCAPQIGNSDEVSIGSWITIIGNSMGVLPSVSFGLVNGILKSGLLQLSAMINPGNSGSPVFDINGKVIGILIAQVELLDGNVVAQSQNLFSEGGLAIPINVACEIVDAIIKSYQEQAGWIGIRLQTDSLPSHRIELIDVIPNSPAAKAGLKGGDVLVKYNNFSMINSEQLGVLIRNTRPGSTVPISFIRDNTRLNVFVTVGVRPPFVDRRQKLQAGYNFNNDRITRLKNNYYNVAKLKNEVRRLEQQIFQLKLIINRQRAR